MKKLVLGLLAVVLAAGLVLPAGVLAAPPHGDKADKKSRPPAPPLVLGVQVAALTQGLADKMGVTYQPGVVVLGVIAGSAAEKAGLKRADVITNANGSPVATPAELKKIVSEAEGQVTLTVAGKGDIVAELSPDLRHPRPIPRSRPWPGRWFLRLLRPEMEGIPAGERFSHFMGAEVRVTDKAGAPHTLKLIPGTVQAVSGDQLTLLTNEGSEVTYTITKDVKGYQLLGKLKEGQKLVVATVDGSVRAIFPPHLPGKPGPRPGTPRDGSGTTS